MGITSKNRSKSSGSSTRTLMPSGHAEPHLSGHPQPVYPAITTTTQGYQTHQPQPPPSRIPPHYYPQSQLQPPLQPQPQPQPQQQQGYHYPQSSQHESLPMAQQTQQSQFYGGGSSGGVNPQRRMMQNNPLQAQSVHHQTSHHHPNPHCNTAPQQQFQEPQHHQQYHSNQQHQPHQEQGYNAPQTSQVQHPQHQQQPHHHQPVAATQPEVRHVTIDQIRSGDGLCVRKGCHRPVYATSAFCGKTHASNNNIPLKREVVIVDKQEKTKQKKKSQPWNLTNRIFGARGKSTGSSTSSSSSPHHHKHDEAYDDHPEYKTAIITNDYNCRLQPLAIGYKRCIFAKGLQWLTVEHYYYAQQFADDNSTVNKHEEEINALEDIHKVRDYVAENLSEVKQGHTDDKYRVMMEITREKLIQHPDLMKLLLSTKDKQLVVAGRDGYWANGGGKGGNNVYGVMLMRFRSDFQEDFAPAHEEIDESHGYSGFNDPLSRENSYKKSPLAKKKTLSSSSRSKVAQMTQNFEKLQVHDRDKILRPQDSERVRRNFGKHFQEDDDDFFSDSSSDSTNDDPLYEGIDDDFWEKVPKSMRSPMEHSPQHKTTTKTEQPHHHATGSGSSSSKTREMSKPRDTSNASPGPNIKTSPNKGSTPPPSDPVSKTSSAKASSTKTPSSKTSSTKASSGMISPGSGSNVKPKSVNGSTPAGPTSAGVQGNSKTTIGSGGFSGHHSQQQNGGGGVMSGKVTQGPTKL